MTGIGSQTPRRRRPIENLLDPPIRQSLRPAGVAPDFLVTEIGKYCMWRQASKHCVRRGNSVTITWSDDDDDDDRQHCEILAAVAIESVQLVGG